MASIFKTLAIAAGTGVAVGICTASGSRQAALRRDDVLDIEPLLDRLESIERRFERSAPEPDLSALHRRIDSQEAEITMLRQMVDTRGAEIQSRLEAEMEVRHQQALAIIEKTVELKLSERISAIEKSLSEQSVSIDSLRERASETDSNLQRLIVAIEKLCERVPLPTPAASAPGAGPVLLPFETHMREANRELTREAARSDSFPKFRSKIFTEEEPAPAEAAAEPKKVRFPLARIFGMLALVVLTQVLR